MGDGCSACPAWGPGLCSPHAWAGVLICRSWPSGGWLGPAFHCVFAAFECNRCFIRFGFLRLAHFVRRQNAPNLLCPYLRKILYFIMRAEKIFLFKGGFCSVSSAPPVAYYSSNTLAGKPNLLPALQSGFGARISALRASIPCAPNPLPLNFIKDVI